MITGEGIFYATVLILLVACFKHLSKTKRLKLIGKFMGGFVILCFIVGFSIYSYNLYQNRLVQQNSLFGVSLKMKLIDVRLVLGEPEKKLENKNSKNEDILIYFYKTYSWGEIDKYIKFKKQESYWYVYAICDLNPNGKIYDLFTFTEESEVVKKLGEPTSHSVNQDGLRKFLTFKYLNIAIEIEKNNITTLCLTDDDNVQYINEYSADKKPNI